MQQRVTAWQQICVKRHVVWEWTHERSIRSSAVPNNIVNAWKKFRRVTCVVASREADTRGRALRRRAVSRHENRRRKFRSACVIARVVCAAPGTPSASVALPEKKGERSAGRRGGLRDLLSGWRSRPRRLRGVSSPLAQRRGASRRSAGGDFCPGRRTSGRDAWAGLLPSAHPGCFRRPSFPPRPAF
jgi:hypothetical protein